MKTLYACFLAGCCLLAAARLVAQQAPAPDTTLLLGDCRPADLRRAPFAAWFEKNYTDYQPDSAVMRALAGLNPGGVKICAVFGTWCSDSQQELPRLLRVLDALHLREDQLRLIAVDRSMSAGASFPYQMVPGLEVYRVPVFAVYDAFDAEKNRIVEYPVASTEADLLEILSGRAYRPNYRSYPLLMAWHAEGRLRESDAVVLAGQLKGKVFVDDELYSCAKVLLRRGEAAEAVAVLRMNVELFPEKALSHVRLAEGYAKAGQRDAALKAMARALELEPGNQRYQEQMQKLEAGGGF